MYPYIYQLEVLEKNGHRFTETISQDLDYILEMVGRLRSETYVASLKVTTWDKNHEVYSAVYYSQ